MSFRKLILGCMLCAVPTLAGAGELVVTREAAQGGATAVALDYNNDDGAAVALQVRLKVPGATSKGTNLANCTSEIPKSHVASCTVTKNGEVLLLIYSNANAALPRGMVSIGTLSFRSTKAGKVEVAELLVSDKNAQPLTARTSLQ